MCRAYFQGNFKLVNWLKAYTYRQGESKAPGEVRAANFGGSTAGFRKPHVGVCTPRTCLAPTLRMSATLRRETLAVLGSPARDEDQCMIFR